MLVLGRTIVILILEFIHILFFCLHGFYNKKFYERCKNMQKYPFDFYEAKRNNDK